MKLLISQSVECLEKAQHAIEYMCGEEPCGKDCDPDVGCHSPQCVIWLNVGEALRKLKYFESRMIDGKE